MLSPSCKTDVSEDADVRFLNHLRGRRRYELGFHYSEDSLKWGEVYEPLKMNLFSNK